MAAVRHWARIEGFEIISLSHRWIVPLLWPGKGYRYFRVTVRRKSGEIRHGWIRCLAVVNFDYNSLETHQIETRWDEKTVA
jgi:hypothetical protein